MRTLTAVLVLASTMPAVAAAQTFSVDDPDGARAAIKISNGGGRPDFELSVDSRLFSDLVRFRAGVGHGRWADALDPAAPAGDDPRVTRIAGSALLFGAPYGSVSLRPYGGVGISAYVPHGVALNVQRGLRLILGMEGSVKRWTLGPEIELDVAHQNGPAVPGVGNDLQFTGRFGIALRRRF